MISRVRRIGMIARWKPVHLGHRSILNALCSMGEEARIGIGSANRYNLRNPFTFDETREMIGLVLEGRGNYEVLAVPDLDDGPRWRSMVKGLFGELDLFVTDNPYVASLLGSDYRLARPVELVPPPERIAVDGTQVRQAMAQGGDWESLVPPAVSRYIKSNRLDERFRREFGLQTLAMATLVK